LRDSAKTQTVSSSSVANLCVLFLHMIVLPLSLSGAESEEHSRYESGSTAQRAAPGHASAEFDAVLPVLLAKPYFPLSPSKRAREAAGAVAQSPLRGLGSTTIGKSRRASIV